MYEVITLYDDRDVELGKYFNECALGLHALIESMKEDGVQCNLHNTNSTTTNQAYIDLTYGPLAHKKIIFAAYTHGNKDCLLVGGIPIQPENHLNLFKEGFFYTNSCLSGRQMGPKLIQNGCSVFIGNSEETFALLTHGNVSANCDNFGIFLFMTQDISAYDAYLKMKENFTNNVNKLLASGDILSAGLLIDSRESLMFLGNKSLDRSSFINS